MRLIVIIAISILVPLSISGCFGKKVILVPTECIIPETLTPEVDNEVKPTTLLESKKCTKNYFKYKEAFEIQNTKIKLCQ